MEAAKAGQRSSRVLLLNANGFPAKFQNNRANVEKRLIACINEDNPKMRVAGIKYVDEDSLPSVSKGASCLGYIVEQIDTDAVGDGIDGDFDLLHYQVDAREVQQRVVAYVFLTPLVEGSRDTFISQTLYPGLIKIMKECLRSSSYSLANHPVYLINCAETEITAPGLIREFLSYSAVGFRVLSLFGKNDFSKVPNSEIGAFYPANGLQIDENGTIEYKYFTLDARSHVLKLKGLSVGNGLNPSGSIHGSSEKMLWSQLIPAVILAEKSGYCVDYSAYRLTVDTLMSHSERPSSKVYNCQIVLEYFEKRTHSTEDDHA